MSPIESRSEPSEAFDAQSFMDRALELWRRLRAVAADNPEASGWLAMWAPVGGAFMRLAATLGKLAFRLRKFDDLDNLMPEELREEIAEDLRDLGDSFPDVAEVIFGLGHLDAAARSVVGDEQARSLAASLLELAERAIDRVLDSAVDIVLGKRESSVGPDDVVSFLGRFEDLAQRVLEQLLAPTFQEKNHD